MANERERCGCTPIWTCDSHLPRGRGSMSAGQWGGYRSANGTCRVCAADDDQWCDEVVHQQFEDQLHKGIVKVSSGNRDSIDPRAGKGNFVGRRNSLVHEWEVDKDHRYRLITVADHTPGYQDECVIEILGEDGLGEPRWSRVHLWRVQAKSSENEILNILVSGIQSLLRKP